MTLRLCVLLLLDERTQQTSYQPVLQLIQNKGQYQFIKVTLENGEQLETTVEHPFYIQGKGWNAAANLKVGDALLLHNGTTLIVKTLDTSVRVDAVYNFTVANLHNYFVGKDGVVAHNGCVGKAFPDRDLPRDKYGNPIPDFNPDGSPVNAPYTQLGTKKGSKGTYPQAREFDANGKPVKDVDFTDHGRPREHTNPHQHRYIPNPTGGNPQRGPSEPLG